MHDGKCSQCLESTLAAGQFDLRTKEALHDVVGVVLGTPGFAIAPFQTLGQLTSPQGKNPHGRFWIENSGRTITKKKAPELHHRRATV
ncbi:Protein of unknown function [Pyronema omphalodes CBS 100304]|uniref:Uncharacterized protein n=1 Tax=Pyronema omphalodes (strain CBS 100304) TaxID=1076935 RepID=U4L7K4_PYROM|nr:Protein of unknown function [Pyronema omphalodes CBS 100304]